MRELSIFVDESGDWGEYKHHSPYYIITFVFHNQDVYMERRKKLHFNTLKGYSMYICFC